MIAVMITDGCRPEEAESCALTHSGEGMDEYVARHGWHFSERAAGYAASLMETRDGKPLSPLTAEEVDAMLTAQGVKLRRKEGHDRVYVANMAKADFWKSSIEDERHLAMYVRDVVDDVDAPEGHIFRRWLSDIKARGAEVNWDELA